MSRVGASRSCVSRLSRREPRWWSKSIIRKIRKIPTHARARALLFLCLGVWVCGLRVSALAETLASAHSVEGARPAATAPISLIYISRQRSHTSLGPSKLETRCDVDITNPNPAVLRRYGAGGACGDVPPIPSPEIELPPRKPRKLHPKRQPRLAQQQAQSKAQLRSTTRRRQFLRWMM